MRRSLSTVFDESVDLRVIFDAIVSAKQDKINVVRAAAAAAAWTQSTKENEER